MRREEIRVAGLAEPISHYTDAVRAGELLFVSGVVAVDTAGRLVGADDVIAQARHVFESMRTVLGAAGCTFALVNPVRQEVFGTTRPASTLVEVPRLAVEGAKIEVECVALLPS